MATSALDMRNQIIGALQTLSSNTEAVYMGMAAAYPTLVNEMRHSLGTTEHMLHGASRSDSQDAALLHLIDETKAYIELSNKTFSQAHNRDQEIHTVLAEHLQSVSALGEFINHIHDDSSAMELISLNAMTVAYKSGSHGRAFSVITEELQRLSSRTIDLTDLVTQQGDILIKRFSEFKQILQELTDKEENIFGSFIQRIDVCFGEFSAGVKQIVRTILELRKRSEKIMEPLIQIMTEVQGHDLIRQSIDHVILSLQEIKPVSADFTVETTLDELSFLELLPDLCSDLLDNIATQIKTNKQQFEENLARAQSIIDSIEAERSRFVRSSTDATNPNSLLVKFRNSHDAFEQLFSDIEELYKKKAWTVARSHEVQYMVKQLDSSFKSFDSLIARFRTIDIASRIEIAKQDVLYQMSGTVNEMTALTLRIEEDVAQSDSITSSFLEAAQRLLEQYRKDYMQTSIFSQHFIRRLRKRSVNLQSTKDNLINSISDSQMFTQTFLSQFNSSLADLDGLKKLLLDIEKQRRTLNEIKQEMILEKRRFMQENGIQEWKLENHKLRSMIERFTIFTHKKIAGDLGGFKVEEGAESGEVTFF